MWYNIHYKEMATISLTDIADQCFIPHTYLKTIESIYTRCLFCESTRDYETEIYQGLCYSNNGMNKQDITICADCLTQSSGLLRCTFASLIAHYPSSRATP
jgi:hypothetical protein